MKSGHRTGPLQELYSSAPFVKEGYKRTVGGKPTEQLKHQITPKEIVSIEDSDANFKISLRKLFKR